MKWFELIYNAAVGVLGECKEASVDLVRIQAARYYVEFVGMLRRQSLLCVASIAGTMMAANLLMILEVSILLYAPFPPAQKIGLAVLIGLAGAGVMSALILRLFSQERWMRLTGADRLVAEAVKDSSYQGTRRSDEKDQ
jgi:hypothetical protein